MKSLSPALRALATSLILALTSTHPTSAMTKNTPAPTAINQTTHTAQTLTLEQKIGQVMLVGFEGTSLTRELRKMMNDIRPGGVILFERNVQSPNQVAELIDGLQEMTRARGGPPLFVAIDQEGGTVTRLREARGFTEYPSAMAVAATGDPANASAVARVTARELKALGFNINFAPVLDVNNNPRNPVIAQRSFGSDAARVAQFGAAYIAALQADGLLAVGKHFPGHGDVMIDSHASLPNVPYGPARLAEVELAPFRAAISANVAGIMTAHITFPELDTAQNLPATLSSAILQNTLREQMGFEGLIFSDSLDMGALADSGHPLPGAAAESLLAGADVLDFNTTAPMMRRVKKDMLARAGNPAFLARLDESVSRILREKSGLARPPILRQAQDERGEGAGCSSPREGEGVGNAKPAACVTLTPHTFIEVTR
jgi:beta-N-acetylhexosaminidase